MNNERRKELDRAIGLIEEAKSIIDEVQSEEQDAFDNMPESFQNGDRGEKAQACLDAMECIADELDNALAHFYDAKGEG